MPSGGEQRRYFAPALVVILLGDLITKYWAEGTLLLYHPVPVVADWIRWRLVYNPGAAFGLHLGAFSRWIFLAVAVLAVVVLWRMSSATPAGQWIRQLALGAVAGGALGNLVDRIRGPQGVVDFIDVGIGSARWPTFNVADIGVSCGAVVLAISLWREEHSRSDPADSG